MGGAGSRVEAVLKEKHGSYLREMPRVFVHGHADKRQETK